MSATNTPTKVLKSWDTPSPEDANVEMFQTVLHKITTELGTWNQSVFCETIDSNGADPLTTDEALKTGVYHGFSVPKALIQKLRSHNAVTRRYSVPLSECGTAFCVAGHVAVMDGWTFMTRPGDSAAHAVIPTVDVPRYLAKINTAVIEEFGIRDVSSVARESLNITYYDSDMLFSGGNNLLDVWALSYAITGGRLTLPTTLPQVDSRHYDDAVTRELTDPEDVADAINLRLAYRANYGAVDRYAKFVDIDRLHDLLADDTEAGDERIKRIAVVNDVPTHDAIVSFIDFADRAQYGGALHTMIATVTPDTDLV